jgi:hypothetical protein
MKKPQPLSKLGFWNKSLTMTRAALTFPLV